MPLNSLIRGLIVSITFPCFAYSDAANKQPAEVVPDAQLKALEKARGVEDEQNKRHEELRKKLEGE